LVFEMEINLIDSSYLFHHPNPSHFSFSIQSPSPDPPKIQLGLDSAVCTHRDVMGESR